VRRKSKDKKIDDKIIVYHFVSHYFVFKNLCFLHKFYLLD